MPIQSLVYTGVVGPLKLIINLIEEVAAGKIIIVYSDKKTGHAL